MVLLRRLKIASVRNGGYSSTSSLALITLLTTPRVASPHNITGKVEGGGGPIAKALVTLWAAGPDATQKLAETQTKDDGSFALKSAGQKQDAGEPPRGRARSF